MIRTAPFARSTDPDTSHDAAADATVHAVNDRELVLLAHYERRHIGMSDFELARILGRAQTSVGSRRADLMKPSRGCVPVAWVDEMLDRNGKPVKAPTPSGSSCRVWQITEAGIEAAERLLERQAA